MLFRGFTEAQIEQAVRSIAADYNHNVRFSFTSQRGSAIRGVLRANSSHERGARLSVSGRHTVAVSWEAHRDFMRALFAQNPEGRITTALADYRGVKDFEQKFPATAWHNAGSQMSPQSIVSLSL